MEFDLDTKAKLAAIRGFLRANGMTWMQYKNADKQPKADMRIIEHDVNIRVARDEEGDQMFYKHYRHRNPVFVRPTDTVDFVVEKVQNAVINAMHKAQNTRARILKSKNTNDSKDR